MDNIEEELNQPEPIIQGKHPSKRKRWWALTKAILGHVLPFLIVGGLIAGIYFPIFTESESETEILDQRQETLEENWEEYLIQAEEFKREIDINKFEITLCPFTEDEYTWNNAISPEEAGMICGNLTVPLYHHDPQGETIQIPVVIWPTLEETESSDPLFIMQGGPGGSTLDMYPDMFYNSRPGNEREIVFVDQRGTRYAAPSLVCNEGDKAEEKENPAEEEGEEENKGGYLAYLQNCHDRLVSEGVDLNSFNTAEIAHDMEFIRQVFDYPEINFYGVSYGSHIAQYLAAYHPEWIRSLILDGVASIPLNYLDKTYSHANRLLENYFVECEEDSFCGEKYPDLITRINDIIDQLDEKPVSITLRDPDSSDTVKEEITGKYFLLYLIFMFRMDSSYATLPYIITQAEKKGFDLLKWYDEILTFEYADSEGLYFAVINGEHTPLNAPEEREYLIPKLNEIENEGFEDNLEEFTIWDISVPTEHLSEMPQSVVPALLMSGHYDPATPPEYGEFALESFSKGQHVIDPVGGHGIAFNDDCTEGILDAFIEDPLLTVDSDCLAAEERRNSLVRPDSISAPFLRRLLENMDFLYLSWLVPPVIFTLMVFRGVLGYLLGFWRSSRGTAKQTTDNENLLQLRFELSSWVYIVGCLAYLLYLAFTITNIDNQAYYYALAFPARYRGILLIAVPLAFITVIIVITSIQLWRYHKKVFARAYMLLQSVFSGFVLAYLIWTGLLWAWVK